MTQYGQIEKQLEITLSRLDDLIDNLLDESNVALDREYRKKELQRISRIIDLSISRKRPVPDDFFSLKHDLLLKSIDAYVEELQYNTYYRLIDLVVKFKSTLDNRRF